MKKVIAGCLLMVSGFFTQVQAQNASYDLRVRNYIEQYKGLALIEQQRCGVPAAITLAQGIHETSAGASELATEANNHFGIKCKKEWTGETFAHTDDRPNECFRKYPSSDHSYKDHSDYLQKSPRYAALFKLEVTDYAGWATGLKRCGYATNPRYAQVLIKLIEDYNLQEFTLAASSTKQETAVKYAAVNTPKPKIENYGSRYATKDEIVPMDDAPENASANVPVAATTAAVAATPKVVPVTTPYTPKPAANATGTEDMPKPAYGQIVKVNGLKAIYARKGYTPLEYAYRADIRYPKLLDINEIDERPLPHDMYLYLERKGTKGVRPTHVVTQGETLFGIAQTEGIQIKHLMAMNQLQPGEEPVPGSVLQLQRDADEKPVVTLKKAKASNIVSTTTEIPEPVPAATVAPATVRTVNVQRQTNNSNIKVSDNNTQVDANEIKAMKPATTGAVINGKLEQIPVTLEEKVEIVAEKTTPEMQVTPAVVTETATTTPTPKIIDPTKEEDKGIVKNAAIKEESVPTPVVVTETAVAQSAPVTEKPKEAVKETISFNAPMKSTTSLEASVPPVVEKPKVEEVKTPVTTPVAKVEEQEPEDELDKLKKQFDKAVYARSNKAATPAAAPVAQQTPSATSTTIIPVAEVKAEPTASAASGEKFYTVKKGDTGFSIAKRNGITVKQLMEMNGLDFGAIKEGQKLRVKP